MIVAALLTPEDARIALPVALAVGYACYHWWRWRMMHPKIVIEELPEPAPKAKAVSRPEKKTEERADAVREPKPQRGTSHWQARREQKMAMTKFDSDATDPHCHERAYRKATEGRPEYFVRLGEYAWRRGAMVETHFWISMAKFNGVEGLDKWIGHIRTRWIQSGRPMERGNVYDQFPLERGSLARAYLMAVCGFSVAVNHDRIADIARCGYEDAQLILENM